MSLYNERIKEHIIDNSTGDYVYPEKKVREAVLRLNGKIKKKYSEDNNIHFNLGLDWVFKRIKEEIGEKLCSPDKNLGE